MFFTKLIVYLALLGVCLLLLGIILGAWASASRSRRVPTKLANSWRHEEKAHPDAEQSCE
jgi:hypothetical protein